MSSFSILCVLGLFLIIGHVALAQDSPTDFVDAHNVARSEVGVPNIVWDDTVAVFAQNYANQRTDCQLVHSSGNHGGYGENIAMSTGDFSGTGAVEMWVDEKANYDHDSNSCVDGEMCGHYTQVVWKNTVRVGCAKVRCDNGGTFITCNYDPPGNFVGQSPY
ncbi:pathogenesis-related protein 1 precursor [Trifolium repens]|nr:pathogenesis-related protein 1 precursor [Trifolium repens]